MRPYANQLLWGARAMLNKTKIVPNIKRARTLRKVLDNLKSNTSTEDKRNEWFEIFEVLATFFDPMLDDVLLISAFETYAKACLLLQGCIVHNIQKPNALKDKQKKKPVFLKDITSNEEVGYFETTLGAKILSEGDYINLYSFTKDATKGLSVIRDRRNTLHFYIGAPWTVDNELLSFVEELNDKVPSEEIIKKKLGFL